MATEIPIVVSIESAKAKQGGDEVVKKLEDIRRKAANTNDETKKLGSVFSQAFNGARSSISSARGALDVFHTKVTSVYRTVFSLKGALLGLGVGAVAKSFLDASNTTEQFKVRLEVLLGSIRKGNELLAKLTTLAARVPQEYEDIMNAATILTTVLGKDTDQITKWTEITADLSAAFGMSIEDTAGQMQRALSAGIASADLFRERGVSAFLGFKAGVTTSAEETKQKILESWEAIDSRWRGATGRLSETWAGTMSMIQDRWFLFRNALMDGAPYEYLKAGFQLINESFNKNAGDMDNKARELGQTFVDVFKRIIMGGAKAADVLGPVFSTISSVLDVFFDMWNSLPPWMKEMGIVAGLLFGVKGVAIVTAGGAALKGIYNGVTDLYLRMGKAVWSDDDYQDVLKRSGRNPDGSIKVDGPNKDPFLTGSFFGSKDTKPLESYTTKAEAILKSLDERVAANRLKVKNRLEKEDATLPAGITMPGMSSGSKGTSKANDNNPWVNPDDLAGVTQFGEQVKTVWTSVAEHAENSMKSSISNFIKTGTLDMMSFSQSIRDMWADMIAEMAARQLTLSLFGQASAPTIGGFGQSGGLLGSAANSLGLSNGSSNAWVNPDTGFIAGSWLENLFGGLNFFADGGVVNSPTAFNFGVAGEAGPEGILPLKRGKDGKLGVSSEGGSSTPVVINMNINTPNAQSFMGNRGEIAAKTAQAMQRAMRNN